MLRTASAVRRAARSRGKRSRVMAADLKGPCRNQLGFGRHSKCGRSSVQRKTVVRQARRVQSGGRSNSSISTLSSLSRGRGARTRDSQASARDRKPAVRRAEPLIFMARTPPSMLLTCCVCWPAPGRPTVRAIQIKVCGSVTKERPDVRFRTDRIPFSDGCGPRCAVFRLCECGFHWLGARKWTSKARWHGECHHVIRSLTQCAVLAMLLEPGSRNSSGRECLRSFLRLGFAREDDHV